ncbi:bacterioferritin [Rubripirellula reticaptiva]|uniref:Bacterioferritin n=1 Tax=Rubripirellula reticaptiva TaxID=2528013 RepID=A0A5C6EF28_9BACT|nr:bacterioferritin [Rubripirellula reticaptiva]TWU47054.1 Bacterioferritin [Rubripirellula reticaptiva]
MTQNDTIQNLQRALSMELTAMHQYQLHACVLDEWGMGKLATKMREELQEELGHSEEFLVRLLFLNAEPSLNLEKTPVRATTLKQMFETDLADEKEAVDFYTTASMQAGEARDIGTRQLFERIAIDEEGHVGWLELQLDLLERMGEPAYIAQHMSTDA